MQRLNEPEKIPDLDNKTKELILLALAITYRSADDTKQHIMRAAMSGASSEEITQVLLIAIKKREAESLSVSREKDNLGIGTAFTEQNNKRIAAQRR
ncbi:MAG: hypothetical protein A2Y03_05765 [Omnitrophica WOR_2 bacterium GWF2_38_59]|nr:MAG: hypothetical protein A2Y03_05765 [Omnitrophica WOR_2 bacterium GWF2_38_59]OGX51024.1 MAG: hypothetical protein A2243_04925 [Omnitrophica WOR_2 bacterium RIFOXYA2_FULL_38_17]OGX54314.1 MAG: hypothetical protein A2267_02985 [Omnitrophica WOR_2 bacterium RIFOXYA12_FULL_38_10]OGX56448.1 MAG: hypothetical protein A2306_11530 [Omnitrophica WOR_2 bacterium RIFOXYB2_FULL_38_16]OGX59762.1 MAG: hypothetical protein A2447_03130 [Omnitrophica WOR_2 bacterium RIFOXYC2_FULL_38_12]HBG61584.1 hypothet